MSNEMFVGEAAEKAVRFSGLMTAALAVSLFNLAGAAVFYFRLQPQIPIFYSLADLNSQLANKEMIFLLPAIGLGMWIAHLVIMRFNKSIDAFMWRLLAMVTLFLEILILIINARIIYLVS